MTTQVVAVRRSTPFRQVVEVLRRHGISAVPVVDSRGRVLGVVSETDLLAKVEFAGDHGEPSLFEGRRHRVGRGKAGAMFAGRLMSAPAVTVVATASVVDAAKLLESTGVKRLPVVDGAGRLVGIVARGDLLSVFLRPDAQIRTEIVDELLGRLAHVEPGAVRVDVTGGEVTLTGDLESRSLVSLVGRMAEEVDGVVGVVNALGWRRDDAVTSALDRVLHHRPYGG
jgi:CBS domain-containing protein